MDRDRNEALAAFLAAFDRRLEAAPLVDRRAQPGEKPVDGRRAAGPVVDAFAYWESQHETGT
jgi:hypothetical protein